VKRLILLILAVSIAAVPLAQAGGDPSPPAQTTAEPPVSTQPPATTEPVLIPYGVTVSGIPVGGMTEEQAAEFVQGMFDQPLRLRHGAMRWELTPSILGASADVDGAVAEALLAAPGQTVVLRIDVDTNEVRAFVASLDGSISRPAKDATVRLVRYRPRISPPRPGFRLAKSATTASIVYALRHGERGPLDLKGRALRPKVTSKDFRSIVVVRRGSKKLFLYRGQALVRRFGVATGQAAYPTPLGRFAIVVKWRNPWWYPPDSDWAKGEKPVPPGPGNPLGTRWMGLSAPLVGIHGTPDAASIGYSASHGCIRMLISDAEWLFDRVGIGTPVFIVGV
jgi:lipoprotein-anchoring transpeptidase ErfK/SrfK